MISPDWIFTPQDGHEKPGKRTEMQEHAQDLPFVGISACLLGQRVRYNGKHKRHHGIIRYFQDKVRWVPICPEVEFGLATPREPMHLQGDPTGPRLVVSCSGVDLTHEFDRWLFRRLDELSCENLSGIILKSRSPSCGIGSVPIFVDGNQEVALAEYSSGLFARAFLLKYPHIPGSEENALNTAEDMEKFYHEILDCHGQHELSVAAKQD